MTVTFGSVILFRSSRRVHQIKWEAEGQGPPLSGCILSYFTQEVIGLL